jgi:hypothetical protein
MSIPISLLPTLFILALIVAVQSQGSKDGPIGRAFNAFPPAPGSFDGITNRESEWFPSGDVMGTSGWKPSGSVYLIGLAAAEKIGMPQTNKNGLEYSCMIQTTHPLLGLSYAAKSSIERTFTNLDVGATYRFTFWQTLISARADPFTSRRGYLPPMRYGVYIDGTLVFRTVPNTYDWVQVELYPFAANSTSARIAILMSSDDLLDRRVGINEVLLEKIAGTSIHI